jgi:hypothetical protein
MFPLELSEYTPRARWLPQCAICKEFVKLEVSMVNEFGQATHEECYVSKLVRKRDRPALQEFVTAGRKRRIFIEEVLLKRKPSASDHS